MPRLVAFLIVGHGATRREAAECAHEALAQYWRRRGDVHYPSAWCRRAARSVFYQRTYDALESFAELPATGVPLYSPATDDRALDDDHRDTVLALVTQLPPQAREVTALILEGLSYMDVAAELDLAESTVRSHASRARVELAALHRSTRRRGKGDR